jgi:Uma2 family endonuclease
MLNRPPNTLTEGSSPAPCRANHTANVKGELYSALREIGRPLGYEVWVEQHIRTKSGLVRYRVPDVCVTLGEPEEEIFTEPPFLCVEILSPDDSALELRARIDEYLEFGVPCVWIIDPESKGFATADSAPD